MPIEMRERDNGKIIEVKATGKLTKEDYQQFVPEVDRLVEQHGKVRILFEMHDFHGWSAGALWQDIRFDMRHFSDIERVAIVGETRWQKGMATFCKPFTRAEIRYFDHEHADEAGKWIQAA